VPTCGSCFWCVNGQTHLCGETADVRTPTRARLGSREVTAMLGLGAFAEFMTIDQRLAVKVESSLPAEQLALIGCGVATGAGAALFTARVEPGSSVVVIGCGGVGQAVIQGAKAAGAARIIAVDPVPMKREFSFKSGATHVIDAAEPDALEAVRSLTAGRGSDYSFEVVGLPETMVQAYDVTRRGGTVVTVGIPSPDAVLSLSASDFFRAEKTIVGSYYGSTQVRGGFQKYVDLIESGVLDVASLVTATYGLEDLPTAFSDLEDGKLIRGMITFGDG
jgi:S-(hydroxymethyl)glutathione dehydrogenase / alcohol dehydrogenase